MKGAAVVVGAKSTSSTGHRVLSIVLESVDQKRLWPLADVLSCESLSCYPKFEKAPLTKPATSLVTVQRMRALLVLPVDSESVAPAATVGLVLQVTALSPQVEVEPLDALTVQVPFGPGAGTVKESRTGFWPVWKFEAAVVVSGLIQSIR